MEKTYGIIEKYTGLFFGGFDDNESVMWVEKPFAAHFRKDVATAQSSLLICQGYKTQRKEVFIGE